MLVLLFDDFHNSVLKLHEETCKNDANEPAQVGASKGPNENSKKLIFPILFLYFCTRLGTCGPSGNTRPLQTYVNKPIVLLLFLFCLSMSPLGAPRRRAEKLPKCDSGTNTLESIGSLQQMHLTVEFG